LSYPQLLGLCLETASQCGLSGEACFVVSDSNTAPKKILQMQSNIYSDLMNINST
jgi:hypothetical protein